MKKFTWVFGLMCAIVSTHTNAAKKPFSVVKGWRIYYAADKISDAIECQAVGKANIFMFAKTGVVVPVGKHMMQVEYRYDKEEPKFKDIIFEQSNSGWAELSVNYPESGSFFEGDVGKFKELRVRTTHVFGRETFIKYSLAGIDKAVAELERCTAKHKADI